MITENIEWESESTRLVSLGGLARSIMFPKGDATHSMFRALPGRRIEEVIIHHSAGNLLSGRTAPKRIAEFCVARPKYELVDGVSTRTGGGRGWPGIAYTYVVPARPSCTDGKFVVYRCWQDEWVTWHTGAGHNERGVGICVAGNYRSRHIRGSSQEPHPDPTAMVALESLVMDYILPRHGLKPAALLGHFDCGKPTCPGDALEQWVRSSRGEKVAVDGVNPLAPGQGDFDSSRERQQALVKLGYDIGPMGVDGIWGHFSRGALEALQDREGLVVDGVWGPITEARVRGRLGAGT